MTTATRAAPDRAGDRPDPASPTDARPWSAVLFLARHELRTRWPAIAALTLVAGVFVGAAAAAAAMLWRTETAYGRLVAVSNLDDVRISAYEQYLDPADRPAVAASLAGDLIRLRDRPGVTAATELGEYVGRRSGSDVRYLTVAAYRSARPSVAKAVVVAGRAPAAERADEVMVEQSRASQLGLRLGSTVSLDMLTVDQFQQFSTGVGAPAGGRVDLRITGLYRFAEPGRVFGPLLAGPGFARAHDQLAVGAVLCLRVRGSVAPFAARARQIDRTMINRFGTASAPYAAVETPRRTPDPGLGPTRAVLRSGLYALVGVVFVASLILTAQLAGRWAERTRASQRVEHVLGLSARDRALARLLTAAPAAVFVGCLAAAGALVGGFFQPLGSLSRYEPSPGWLPQTAITVLAGIVAFVLVVTVVLAAVLRTGSRRTEAQATRRAPRGGAPKPGRTSFAAALARRRGGAATSLPVRSMVAGLAAMVAVLVSVSVVRPQLSGLGSQPYRWGWTADFEVLDDTPAVDASLVRIARVRDVERVVNTTMQLRHEGRSSVVTTYGRRSLAGRLPWTVAAGAVPVRDDEIALGPRAAHDLSAVVGDRITVVRADIGAVTLRLVGILQIPTTDREPLGNNAMLTQGELMSLGVDNPYSSALVRADTPADAQALQTRLGRALELQAPFPPDTVSALDELATPTRVLLAVLVLAVALLVSQNVRVLLRRRRTQLAVADAIGLPRGRRVSAIVASLAGVSLAAAVIGAPAGWALGRLVLAEIGPRLGLALRRPDFSTAALAAGALLAFTVLLAAVAGWWATRGRVVDARPE